MVVSQAIETQYAFAYAFASGLGVWESGRLRKADLWNIAPQRSRFRIAAAALAPVVVLTWLMLLLPVTVALVQTTTAPTPGSLLPLLMAMVLCMAHASIGFGVGLRVSPMIAAPVMMVLVWVVVAYSWTVDTMWVRHVLGQFPTTLMFGERATLLSLAPHILLTGGIAVGLWLLWLPLRQRLVRAALACLAVVCAAGGSWAVAHTWNYNPPLATRAAPERCLGEEPKVCVPEIAADRLPDVRSDVVSVLRDFNAVGVAHRPEVVLDSMQSGRFSPKSTDTTWHLPLAALSTKQDHRYQTALATVRFPCRRPDPMTGLVVQGWVARVTHEEPAYQRMVGPLPDARSQRRLEGELSRVGAMPEAEQAEWFQDSLVSGCQKAGPRP
ncbi:hypothetical protein [Streptomyces sp. SP18CS02]|uniref:hypothetical protein n=1 Tax=Streptomyces sp. SP18CS02 TaxID=3002531 RepID=UPI002E769B09|nr:hypothetical protein [Streptomyces sp. SP18CS02]MEE1755716.1 hypothetical protein [Streptomyces sp. SP18CS02]